MNSDRQRLLEATVLISATVRDAMQCLDRSGLLIALVVDDAERLVGILTDGDIRRALLTGAALSTPVADHVRRNFISVAPSAARAEVIELMQARYIQQVPVVDPSGKLVGLHLLRDVIGTPARANWAVVMAGGRGTRLAPLTDDLPKPMLRVAGRPILERIVLHLVGQGVRRIFVAINYLGDIIRDHFGDGSAYGAQIEYLVEEQPLGTGGALSLLPARPIAPVLVMNGDLVTQANVGGLLDFHAAGSQVATVAVREYFHTVPFGCVELEGDRLVRLEEKPTMSRLVNAGIYVLAPQLIATIAPRTRIDLPEIIGAAMNRREDVRAFELEGDWLDVGQRDQLSQARGGA
ncbi:MAG: nucleotidyltransferase family protein [Deltaproteobacteria bacterium]